MAKRFDQLEPKLNGKIVKAVKSEFGFVTTTPVQMAAIPLFLKHKDVVVEACTGSGKTLAFVLPILQRVMEQCADAVESGADPKQPLLSNRVAAVVVSPTRELARQTFGILRRLVEVGGLPIRVALMVGGSDIADDLSRAIVGGCNILCGTPGRMADVMQRSATPGGLDAARAAAESKLEATETQLALFGVGLDFRQAKTVVLDEADTLLDLGLGEAVARILARVPKQRRTGLFSATMSRGVKDLARAGLRNPVVIRVKVQASEKQQAAGGLATPVGLSSFMTTVAAQDKPGFLASVLRHLALGRTAQPDRPGFKVIVFFLTCAQVQLYARTLPVAAGLCDASGDCLLGPTKPQAKKASGGRPVSWLDRSSKWPLPVIPLYGKMDDKKRRRAFAHFREADAAVLLCTDVGARGIDLPNVDWIIQMDPPADPSFFVHRVGRTARAGRDGSAMVVTTPEEAGYDDVLAQLRAPVVPLPPADAVQRLVTSLTGQEAAGPLFTPSPAESRPGKKKGKDQSAVGNKRQRPTASAAAGAGGAEEEEATAAATGSAALAATPVSDPSQTVLSIRRQAVHDRDVLEKGSFAFVSFVRGYREHVYSNIFSLSRLPLGRVAEGFGLLKLPHVKELRGIDKRRVALPRFDASTLGSDCPLLPGTGVVDTSKICYANAEREAARQKRLAEERQRVEAAAAERGVEVSDPSLKMAGRGDKAAKEAERRRRRQEAAVRQQKDEEAGRAAASSRKHRRGKQSQLFEEWDDLAREERLAKRRRQGKITEEEFKQMLAEEDEAAEPGRTGAGVAKELARERVAGMAHDQRRNARHVSKATRKHRAASGKAKKRGRR